MMTGLIRSALGLLIVSNLAWVYAGCEEERFHIDRVDPRVGLMRGGEKVTIAGSGFEHAQMMEVWFGDKKANHLSFSGTDRLYVNTPEANRPGKIVIRVIAANGTELLVRNGFEYVKKNRMADCVNISRALNGQPLE